MQLVYSLTALPGLPSWTQRDGRPKEGRQRGGDSEIGGERRRNGYKKGKREMGIFENVACTPDCA